VGWEMSTTKEQWQYSGWEGNHRFGVALAMHHRLCGSVWYINLWAQWPKEGR